MSIAATSAASRFLRSTVVGLAIPFVLLACGSSAGPEADGEQSSDAITRCTHCPKPPPIALCGAVGEACCTKSTNIPGTTAFVTTHYCNDPNTMSCTADNVCVARPAPPPPGPPCGGIGERCCTASNGKPYCNSPADRCKPAATGVTQAYPLMCESSPDPVPPAGDCTSPVSFTMHNGGSRGGPATLVPILWGFDTSANTALYAEKLDITYRQLEESNYYGWLRTEYGAPALSHLAPITQNCAPDFYGRCPSGHFDLGAIKNSLDAQIRDGHLPSPSNPIYVIHMPPGATTDDLCSGELGFNGYENTFDAFNDPGQRTRDYIVVPDPTSPCGLDYDGVTRVLSHEIAENITDPLGDKSGWRDDTQTCNGGHQIGDICNNLQSFITTPYVQPSTGSNRLAVQKLWSNKLGKCVTEDVLWAPLD